MDAWTVVVIALSLVALGYAVYAVVSYERWRQR